MNLIKNIERKINRCFNFKNLDYKIKFYLNGTIPEDDLTKIRILNIFSEIIYINHSYVVIYKKSDNAIISFIQFEYFINELDENGKQTIYYIHSSGTDTNYRRLGLNIILKIAICKLGYNTFGIYVSSVKDEANSLSLNKKFGFEKVDPFEFEFQGTPYYANTKGDLRDEKITKNVDELYKNYLCKKKSTKRKRSNKKKSTKRKRSNKKKN